MTNSSMPSTGVINSQPIPLQEAEAIARELVTTLAPWCERIEIAGSIRRRKPQVKDIEIVAVPKVKPQLDLFGATVGYQVDIDGVLEKWLGDGTLNYRLDKNDRHAWGPRYKRAIYQSRYSLDLFLVLPPAQFGVIYTIRTGPAEFSHRLVTPQWHGGYLPSRWRVQDGRILNESGAPQETPDERDVFALLGLEWQEPTVRS